MPRLRAHLPHRPTPRAPRGPRTPAPTLALRALAQDPPLLHYRHDPFLARHFQLPEVLVVRCQLDHVRPAHEPAREGAAGRGDLLPRPVSVDLGEHELPTWQD